MGQIDPITVTAWGTVLLGLATIVLAVATIFLARHTGTLTTATSRMAASSERMEAIQDRAAREQLGLLRVKSAQIVFHGLEHGTDSILTATGATLSVVLANDGLHAVTLSAFQIVRRDRPELVLFRVSFFGQIQQVPKRDRLAIHRTFKLGDGGQPLRDAGHKANLDVVVVTNLGETARDDLHVAFTAGDFSSEPG